ncbi:MAG: SagB family peptide dehydrogenase [Acidobacteriota bacterium]|jgi:SagB-type dehydrogenase family enzyme
MRLLIGCVAVIGLALCSVSNGRSSPGREKVENPVFVSLPAARAAGTLSLEAALSRRRTVRSFRRDSLSLEQVGQLTWAAQGTTGANREGRTAPSAGGLYPLELYVLASRVEKLAPGVYRYESRPHRLRKVLAGDVIHRLAPAALRQEWVEEAPVVFLIAAVASKTTVKYGSRGIRYVHMEAGHAAQNLALQAEALELGAGVVGAFQDGRLAELTGLPGGCAPLYLLPVGRKR